MTQQTARAGRALTDVGVTYQVTGMGILFAYIYADKGEAFWAAFYDVRAPWTQSQCGEIVRDLKKKNPAANFRAKLVGGEGLVQEAQTWLKNLGVQIEKAVERDRIEILFSPGRRQLQLRKPFVDRKIRVLIVDDSATVCTLLKKILSSSPELEVVDAVMRPSLVAAAIEKHKPDVITLDIHLPEINGVELLKQYLPKHPIPTVMISSIHIDEGPLVLAALEAGAIDYLQKPEMKQLAELTPILIDRIKSAARSRVRKGSSNFVKRAEHPNLASALELIAIGSSTGGTEALKELFLRLPDRIPPIVVVQHIPAVFSKAFADRLNELLPFQVKEASEGDELKPGLILIAPGGKQMRVQKRKGQPGRIQLDDGPAENRHKPSVDVLFHSLVQQGYGKGTLAVMLTGMGSDGAKGMLALHQAGAHTIAQDESSCVVYGMPHAAVTAGAVDEVVHLLSIAEQIAAFANKKSA